MHLRSCLGCKWVILDTSAECLKKRFTFSASNYRKILTDLWLRAEKLLFVEKGLKNINVYQLSVPVANTKDKQSNPLSIFRTRWTLDKQKNNQKTPRKHLKLGCISEPKWLNAQAQQKWPFVTKLGTSLIGKAGIIAEWMKHPKLESVLSIFCKTKYSGSNPNKSTQMLLLSCEELGYEEASFLI